jgi:preprotein translocase subunit SecE
VAERKRRGRGADGEPAGNEDRDSLDSLDEAVVDDDPAEDTLADSESADAEDTEAGAGQRKAARRRGATAVRRGSDDESDDDDEPRSAKKVAAGKGKDVAKSGSAKSGSVKADKGGKKKSKPETNSRAGGRPVRFVREVVAELRKVIWPTRKELVTYAIVVLVFVAVILTIVGLLDYGFAKGALWVFGSGNK